MKRDGHCGDHSSTAEPGVGPRPPHPELAVVSFRSLSSVIAREESRGPARLILCSPLLPV